jgi:serine/threonine protein kinase
MSGAQIPLGPFALHGLMGRGAMAEVWHGVHRRRSLPVAVKVITGRGARDPERAELIRAEAQAVARLHHPGIVVVLDHGEVSAEAESASGGLIPAGSPYIAMELAARGSLRDVPGRLLFADVKGVLLALLDALSHAHARGVIHRDLKPSNVLCFGEKGTDLRLKLADFGLSYALDRQGRRDEDICGTPWYMAPEQVLGNWRDYGPWTDLYALGCLAYELVCDAPLFADRDASGASRAQVQEEPPPLVP